MSQPLKKPALKKQRISILGSTGSIGKSTIDVINSDIENFEVVALTANNNAKLLAEQAIKLHAKIAVIADETKYSELKKYLKNSKIEIAAGAKAVEEAAKEKSDFVMAAIIGAAGLPPTIQAIKSSKKVGIANKESLVCAGKLISELSAKSGCQIIPVDSEHNSIFQIFDYEKPETVEKIILTASGGPFLNFSKSDMENITPAQAVKHPNWSMGAKISVDSATMMNKGLELIEAFQIFPVKESQIEILVHPESIIHGLVYYIDGSVLAGLSNPDMKIPISHAIAWPERSTGNSTRLDLVKTGKLSFFEPDYKKFPAINIARSALKTGGSATTTLNAANEIAANYFLEGKIKFTSIIEVVEKIMKQSKFNAISSLDDVFAADKAARILATTIIDGKFLI